MARTIWFSNRNFRFSRVNGKYPVSTAHVREQGWRSDESARLPPMCPWFDSRTPRHMWVEFCCWFSSLLREVFLRVLRFFPPSQNPTFFKFQSDLDYCQHFIMSLWFGWPRKHSLCLDIKFAFILFIYFIYLLLLVKQFAPENPTSQTQTLAFFKYGSQYPLLLQFGQARAFVQPSAEFTIFSGFLRSYICLLFETFRMQPVNPV